MPCLVAARQGDFQRMQHSPLLISLTLLFADANMFESGSRWSWNAYWFSSIDSGKDVFLNVFVTEPNRSSSVADTTSRNFFGFNQLVDEAARNVQPSCDVIDRQQACRRSFLLVLACQNNLRST